MISIIIPVYNAEAYLPQCIDSVLNQSYQNYELILVDDGSTDKSPAICDEYAQKNDCVRVIHQTNKGVGDARNNGIKLSKGEWITFIDSDDWVDPDYLANFNIDGNDADLICQGLKFFDNRSGNYFEHIKVNDCTLDGASFKKNVAENKLLNWGYPVSKAIRRSILEKGILFNTSISLHEDHIFVFAVLNEANIIRLVSSTSYNYRYFHSNNTLSSRSHSWESHNTAAECMIKELNELRDRFLEPESAYEKRIYTFAYKPKINAVFELFRLSNKTEQRKAMQAVICRDDIKKYYFPIELKNKLVKLILCYAPFIVQRLFFTSYIKYQDKKCK